MKIRAMRWPLFLTAGLGLGPLGCMPEGSELVPMQEAPADPCGQEDANLADGIQDGAEMRAVFECLNRTGEFDTFVPLIDAMEQARISDGNTTVLDMWVNILNEELKKARGSDVSLTTADLVATLEDAISLLSEPWLPSVIGLVGDALENGALEPAVPLLGNLVTPIVNLQNTNRYDAYLDTLQTLLCPDLEKNGQCTGNVQQVYRGLMASSAANGTPAAAMPEGDTLTSLLIGILAPAGASDATNLALNQALGMGVAQLGKGSFLVDTLSRDLPALYGDDPTTPQLEGYETYNANKSALYGILSMMGSPAIDPDTGMTALEETEAELNAVGPLVSNYYVWSPSNTRGQTGKPPAGGCVPQNSSDFAKANPAYFGLDQILRMMKGADVDYTDSSLCKTTIDGLLAVLPTVLGSDYYELELSGTTNIASLLLEIFSQLPVEVVQDATDAGSYASATLTLVNSVCGTDILADDYEALQASVHIEEVIEPTLELMAAVNHAGQMDALKNIIVGLYDTHALCYMQPWLAEVLQKNGPLVDAVPLMYPTLPGATYTYQDPTTGQEVTAPYNYDDTIMLPLLKTLLQVQGSTALTLVPPIAEGLAASGEDLGALLNAVGRVALAARTEAQSGGNPALYQLGDIMKDLSTYDPNYTGLESIARTIEEQVLLTGILETLAAPEVQNALILSEDGSQTPVEFLSDVVNSGAMLDILELIRSLLITIDDGIKNPSSEQASN